MDVGVGVGSGLSKFKSTKDMLEAEAEGMESNDVALREG
jgi:hypothetical protein